LIPVALIAGLHWRAFLSASATATTLALLSLLAFGWETWLAFFHSIPHTSDAVLSGGQAGWDKIHTAYGFASWIRAGDKAAWAWQTVATILATIGVALLWRSRVPFALKAAALCTAVLLATPYAYIYDFPILAVAIAFLYRHRPFDRTEAGTLLVICLL